MLLWAPFIHTDHAEPDITGFCFYIDVSQGQNKLFFCTMHMSPKAFPYNPSDWLSLIMALMTI